MFKHPYFATPADPQVYSVNSSALRIVSQGCCQSVSLDFLK